MFPEGKDIVVIVRPAIAGAGVTIERELESGLGRLAAVAAR